MRRGDKLRQFTLVYLTRDASIRCVCSFLERPSEITSRGGKSWPTLRSFAKYLAVTFTLVEWTYPELTAEVTRNTFPLLHEPHDKFLTRLFDRENREIVSEQFQYDINTTNKENLKFTLAQIESKKNLSSNIINFDDRRLFLKSGLQTLNEFKNCKERILKYI